MSGFYQKVSGILGIVLLLYTLANIKSGQVDLFTFFSSRCSLDAEVTREGSGCLFWFVILLQTLMGIGLIVLGPKFERALGFETMWSL